MMMTQQQPDDSESQPEDYFIESAPNIVYYKDSIYQQSCEFEQEGDGKYILFSELKDLASNSSMNTKKRNAQFYFACQIYDIKKQMILSIKHRDIISTDKIVLYFSVQHFETFKKVSVVCIDKEWFEMNRDAISDNGNFGDNYGFMKKAVEDNESSLITIIPIETNFFHQNHDEESNNLLEINPYYKFIHKNDEMDSILRNETNITALVKLVRVTLELDIILLHVGITPPLPDVSILLPIASPILMSENNSSIETNPDTGNNDNQQQLTPGDNNLQSTTLPLLKTPAHSVSLSNLAQLSGTVEMPMPIQPMELANSITTTNLKSDDSLSRSASINSLLDVIDDILNTNSLTAKPDKATPSIINDAANNFLEVNLGSNEQTPIAAVPIIPIVLIPNSNSIDKNEKEDVAVTNNNKKNNKNVKNKQLADAKPVSRLLTNIMTDSRFNFDGALVSKKDNNKISITKTVQQSNQRKGAQTKSLESNQQDTDESLSDDMVKKTNSKKRVYKSKSKSANKAKSVKKKEEKDEISDNEDYIKANKPTRPYNKRGKTTRDESNNGESIVTGHKFVHKSVIDKKSDNNNDIVNNNNTNNNNKNNNNNKDDEILVKAAADAAMIEKLLADKEQLTTLLRQAHDQIEKNANIVSKLELRMDNLAKTKEDGMTGGHRSALNTLKAVDSLCTPASSISSTNYTSTRRHIFDDENGLYYIREDGNKEYVNIQASTYYNGQHQQQQQQEQHHHHHHQQQQQQQQSHQQQQSMNSLQQGQQQSMNSLEGQHFQTTNNQMLPFMQNHQQLPYCPQQYPVQANTPVMIPNQLSPTTQYYYPQSLINPHQQQNMYLPPITQSPAFHNYTPNNNNNNNYNNNHIPSQAAKDFNSLVLGLGYINR